MSCTQTSVPVEDPTYGATLEIQNAREIDEFYTHSSQPGDGITHAVVTTELKVPEASDTESEGLNSGVTVEVMQSIAFTKKQVGKAA